MLPLILEPQAEVNRAGATSAGEASEVACVPMPSPPLASEDPREQRVVLRGISWEQYGQLLAALEGQRQVHVNYDRGALEIMVVSFLHERWKSVLMLVISLLAEQRGVRVRSAGSATLRNPQTQRGLEPDACWYVAREPDVRGLRELDLTQVPPPDLAVEIEVSRTFVDRLQVCAAMGIPEIWRFDGTDLRGMRLEGEQYTAITHSLAFPGVLIEELGRFVASAVDLDDVEVMRLFREWLRGERVS